MALHIPARLPPPRYQDRECAQAQEDCSSQLCFHKTNHTLLPHETAGTTLSEAAERSTFAESAASTSCNQVPVSEASSSAVESLSESVAPLSIEKPSDHFWECLLDAYNQDDQSRPIVEYAKKLEEVVCALDITTECVAVLTDFDMATEIESYFVLEEHEGSISVKLLFAQIFLPFH